MIEEQHIPVLARPKSFARFDLRTKVCECGHEDMGHNIDATCGQCVCHRYREASDA